MCRQETSDRQRGLRHCATHVFLCLALLIILLPDRHMFISAVVVKSWSLRWGHRERLLVIDVPKYVTSQFVFFPPVCVFSSLAHMNSLSRAHSKCSWNVWCGLSVARVSPAPFTRKSSWFRICFYSPVCLELYYKLGRKNLSQTCHVFPERRM